MGNKADIPNLLSAVATETIMVICEDCEILRKVNCYELLAKHGDMTMPSVLDPVARSLNCPRVDNKFYDRCRLCFHFRPDEWARKSGYIKPEEAREGKETNPRFRDLSEWNRLYAGCRACGNKADIDRWKLQKRFGIDAKLSDVAARLSCKCGDKTQGYIGITNAKRD